MSSLFASIPDVHGSDFHFPAPLAGLIRVDRRISRATNVISHINLLTSFLRPVHEIS
jgi:hypothetical protein